MEDLASLFFIVLFFASCYALIALLEKLKDTEK
jgi:hypothetical protein